MRLDLVVGPNGAGKSTFVQLNLAPAIPASRFVNADVIAAQQWPDAPEAHSYEAARIAEHTRFALIQRRLPLIAETIFSHPSKLELITAAHERGYEVYLHAILVPEQLAVERVPRRVSAGGHAVPEEKIRQRYRRLWPLVAEAIKICDSAVVYDNTRRTGPVEVARFRSGVVVGVSEWPEWTPSALVAQTF